MLLSSGFPIAGEQHNRDEPVIEELQVELGPPRGGNHAREATTQCTGILTPVHSRTTFIRNHLGPLSKQGSALYFYQAAISEEVLVPVARNGQMVYSLVVERVIQ